VTATILDLSLTLPGPTSLFVIGAFGLFALAMSFVARRWLPISEVVAFLVIGVVLGPRVLGVIDRHAIDTVEPLTALALGAIVFVTGERLRLRELRRLRRTLLPISLLGSVVAFGLCLGALRLAGVSGPTAYLLAAIAPSTAPVTVQALVAERRAAGPFTDHVLAATALNTLAAALLFGIGAPFVFAKVATGSAQREAVHSFVQLVVVSAVIGVAGGVALRLARRRVERWGDRVLLVWVSLLLMVGAVEALNSSVVITTLIAGAVVANDRQPAHDVFDAVRVLEAPIFLVFFIVTGADVHVGQFVALGKVGAVYFAARWAGRVLGSWLGVLASPARGWGWGHRIGTAQLPYAGMAVGLASYTVGRAAAAGAPDVGTDVAALVLGTVFLFEVLTPLLLDRALVAMGEAAGGSPRPAKV
jgi:Kef-type K+ transport system membrane component KefB